MKAAPALAAPALLLAPAPAAAHTFGQMYALPVPVWMYLYGASAALAVSFVAVGYFVTAGAASRAQHARDVTDHAWVRALRRARVVPALQALAVGLLLLCIATGLFGSRNPYLNFNMTFFWVVFVLGFFYLTALVGDLFALINPGRVIADALGRVVTGFGRGRLRYPQRLGAWPALALYMAFIWVELFGRTQPLSLSVVLIVYSAITLAGIWVFGKDDWLRHGEFFGVMLRLVARMAPLEVVPPAQPGDRGRLRLRMPFAGLLQEHADSFGLVLFVLFMLSSTAFDGLAMTIAWKRLFWQDPFNVIKPWVGTDPTYAYTRLRTVYLAWETVCLVLSPFVYLAVYLAFIALCRRIARSALPVREMALRFAFTLLPIALVYNVTHYYTLLLSQGVQILGLLSDPFGWGWNLFGTAGKYRAPWLPGMGTIWHTQVALILLGHIASVVLAHLEALRLFPTRRQATLSQLPMLVLMVLFTAAGLWILAQPIQSGGP